jgi:hypothetical protein
LSCPRPPTGNEEDEGVEEEGEGIEDRR